MIVTNDSTLTLPKTDMVGSFPTTMLPMVTTHYPVGMTRENYRRTLGTPLTGNTTLSNNTTGSTKVTLSTNTVVRRALVIAETSRFR